MTQQVQPPPHAGQSPAPQQTAAGTTVPTRADGPLPSLNPNRQSLRLGTALLIIGAVLYMIVTPLLHPGGGTPIAEFQSYAASRSWAAVHSIQFACSVMAAFGLLALVHGLNVTSGTRGLINRFAAATAAALIAINAALYAVDGVALKTAVDGWMSRPAAARPAFLPAVEAVRGVEFGLRGYVAYTTGLALILLAVVIVSTARIPRVVGYLMGLTGLVYIAQGVGWIGLRTVISEHALEGNISYYVLLLVLAWSIWLFLVASRMKQVDTRTFR